MLMLVHGTPRTVFAGRDEFAGWYSAYDFGRGRPENACYILLLTVRVVRAGDINNKSLGLTRRHTFWRTLSGVQGTLAETSKFAGVRSVRG